MDFTAGAKLGPYEIVQAIGAGGMGQVYKARDTRLNRFVAIKVLPEHLSQSLELKARFEREAQTLASLSHPHICPVFDVGRQEQVDFLVMEYLEGQTLAQRLEKGALPVDESLRIGAEIADALDKAHRRGITHRDIKPGNIMLTKSGAKLLDFGLAKFRPGLQPSSDFTNLPTNAAVTGGAILGTLQYMAPEQLEGAEADARADIFAFGATLHEMLTGRRAFEGKSQATLISAIMSAEPRPVSSIAATCPPALDHLVRMCLQKDPSDRWQTAHDLTIQLRWLIASPPAAPDSAPTSSKSVAVRRERLLWAGVSLLLAIAVVALGYGRWTQSPPRAREVRFTVPAPDGFRFYGSGAAAGGSNPTLSPDGRFLAFIGLSPSGPELFVRPLDSVETRLVPDTKGAQEPFWSPDSRFIGFFAEGKLKKVQVAGGGPQVVCDGIGGAVYGGTWNRDGVIVFSSGAVILRVPAQGGAPVAVTKLAADEFSHRWPYFLPDGKHYLFSRLGKKSTSVYIASLEAPEVQELVQTNYRTAFANPGYLLFVRNTELVAQAFDPKGLKLIGDPTRITEGIELNDVFGNASFSVSDDGHLAYREPENAVSQLVWFDRSGKQLNTVGEPADYTVPGLSPDGKKLVVAVARRGSTLSGDIWMRDLERDTFRRLTFDPIAAVVPVFAPDGKRIVFMEQSGAGDLYIKDIGGGPESELLKSSEQKVPTDWSRDGQQIMYQVSGAQLWIVPVNGEHKGQPYLQGPLSNVQGRFSPDGHWVAYTSDEGNRPEIYINSFPKPGAKYQISTKGGGDPRWSADGKELFFISNDQKLMSVAIKATSQGLEAGRPIELFKVHVSGLTDTRTHYAVAPDGRRFLVVTVDEVGVVSPITLVLNWTMLLKK